MVTASSSNPAAPITHQRTLIAFSGLILALFLAALDSTIVATALPTIVGEVGGLAHLSWVVTAYLLAQTIVSPLYGKLGDLYGRKIVLQAAIVLFLAGSALCGLSRTMTQLVLFRGLQGLGGGGLIVSTQAAIGDFVPARERGRYMGIFGAVFGVSSIAGPLLGGYFTTHLSWRWIFYINLPFGIAALFVLAATLPSPGKHLRHAVDYAGAVLLASALSSLILITDLAGTNYAWDSPLVLGLAALALGSLVCFGMVERRAPEPVLPLRLFANRTFAVTSAVGFIVGFALFGAITYVPLFLQVVSGASPTLSGLLLMPMMVGMLVTSILSGHIISRTGRYRFFPIFGTAVLCYALWLLARINTQTSQSWVAMLMFLVGFGLGNVMQVLLIAAQNAVAYRDLGVATSGATLFRLIGGSFGTAVLGAIFASRLDHRLADMAAAGTRIPDLGGGMGPQQIAHLPATLRSAYAQACAASLQTVFLVAAAVSFGGFLLAWLLPETPLQQTITTANRDIAETFAMPTDAD